LLTTKYTVLRSYTQNTAQLILEEAEIEKNKEKLERTTPLVFILKECSKTLMREILAEKDG
jgi:hypothetical protein